MDRKIKKRINHHYDKPAHQRWLYKLSDIGIVKAVMLIWGICWIVIALSILFVKVVLAQFK